MEPKSEKYITVCKKYGDITTYETYHNDISVSDVIMCKTYKCKHCGREYLVELPEMIFSDIYNSKSDKYILKKYNMIKRDVNLIRNHFCGECK